MMTRIHRIFVHLMLGSAICCSVETVGQDFEISAGIGFPDVPNVGLKILNETVSFGFAYGFVPNNDIRTINLDLGFFYGKQAKNAEARKSVFRTVFTHYREETERRIFNHSYLTFRVGWNYFFTSQFGLNLEGGISVEVGENIISKDGTVPTNFNFVYDNVFPSLSIRFFYRI
ncbi:hypothetical protein [Ekhidna sp.]|uniref:hypothetical protein n=1 Tax=Ekhidna sp. TaxID=2608089 RepID=UPI00329728A4